MSLTLKFNPILIHWIVNFKNNRENLFNALLLKGYSEIAANSFVLHPEKLLWSNLLIFLEGKLPEVVNEILNILAKLTI
jgi:hypothetical protein